MRILTAINRALPLIPFQYMAAVLKEKGHQVDIVVYPQKKKHCWAMQFYLKLETIYLRGTGYEIDSIFAAYKYDNKPIDFLSYINNDNIYDYIISFCDSFPNDLKKIKCNHKWYVSNYNDPGCYGIDTAAYIIRNKGATPLYIFEASDNKIVYFSESLTEFPLIIRNDVSLLCKAINVIIRYVSKCNLGQDNHSAQPMQKKNKPPSTSGRFIALHLIRLLCRKLTNTIFTEQYNILIGENIKQLPPNPKLLRKINTPKDRFWADPFIIEYNNLNFLFVEELIFAKNKGVIRCLPFKDLNNIDEGKVVLEKPYHLSFPFIFKYGEKYYMLPETRQNRTIELYECIEFPYKWTKKRTLMKDIEAVDSFISFQNDKWWMFTNIAPGPGASCNDELNIFYTDDPVNGEWISHPSNPVVEGASVSRNAGKLFEHQGKLYRPSQICVGHYGFGININEVIKLDVNEYKESCVHQITPSKRDEYIKIHAMDWGIKYLVLDGAIMLRKKLKDVVFKPNSL